MDNSNQPNSSQVSNNSYVGWLLTIVVLLLATLPFHYVFYDGIEIFPKDNFTFSNTFVTVEDIDILIKRHNEANFLDQASIRSESLHKKLMERGIITTEKRGK